MGCFFQVKVPTWWCRSKTVISVQKNFWNVRVMGAQGLLERSLFCPSTSEVHFERKVDKFTIFQSAMRYLGGKKQKHWVTLIALEILFYFRTSFNVFCLRIWKERNIGDVPKEGPFILPKTNHLTCRSQKIDAKLFRKKSHDAEKPEPGPLVCFFVAVVCFIIT